ncbi:ribosome assembly RNA-binding protein YhbY [Paenibacillus senegalensis]|uniref:ribosome assembly RNA-binding protein YhbY n=1 Tax=Paenibacillus senegalensis TaxID=1465766 RepID=UPI000288D0D5|nr:ribosome assembly RNA-binding protein YhbY [Paenibacillus senegalensis]
MLTNKQKKFLRSLAHSLNPIFQVGKGGVNEAMITSISEALEVRELIKISVLNNCMEDKHDIAAQLSEGTGAEVVQVIGNIIVLYKQSKEQPKIELP